MTVTVQDVAKLVGAKADDAVLPVLLAQSQSMIGSELKQNITVIPEAEYDGAVLQLCSELWARRKAPTGGIQWGPDGGVARLAADPMTSVRPMIKRYIPIGRPR